MNLIKLKKIQRNSKSVNLHNKINNGVAQKMALIIDKDGDWRIKKNFSRSIRQ